MMRECGSLPVRVVTTCVLRAGVRRVGGARFPRLHLRQYSSPSSSKPSIQAAPSPSTSGSSSSSTSSSPATPSSANPVVAPASSKRTPSLQRRQRTDLALILGGTLSLAALGFYTLHERSPSANSNQHAQHLSTLTPSSKSFTLPISTSSGTQFRTISMYSAAKVTEVLAANERSYSISRPGNPLYRYDTNSVKSNEICEDTQSFTILEHADADYVVSSVFDGHSGYHTSRLLAENLEKYIARELFDVLTGRRNYGSIRMARDSNGAADASSWYNWLWSKSKQQPSPSVLAHSVTGNGVAGLNERSLLIPEALRTAFLLADKDIVQPPLDYLRSLDPSASSPSSTLNPPTPLPAITDAQRQKGLSLLQPALSGSCSLSTLLDASDPHSPVLYVAVAGDSRAVMGTFNPQSKKWVPTQLCQDQTGKSADEVKRMRAEHPKAENDTVIMRGRVLGGLEPTRALGDAKYKWPVGMQERLVQLFKPSTSRITPPSLYKTPPYVTALPEVSVYNLGSAPAVPASSSTDPTATSLVAPSTTSQPTGSGRRFIVLATDGLYDCMSSEEVVALVGAHLDGQKGSITRKALFSTLDTSTQISPAMATSPHKPRSSSTLKGEDDNVKRYVFEDDNLSTHLIRNALGGGLKEQVSALLSIPPPYSRRYRDDITITVLLLDDPARGDGAGHGLAAKGAGEKFELLKGVRRIWDKTERSKL